MWNAKTVAILTVLDLVIVLVIAPTLHLSSIVQLGMLLLVTASSIFWGKYVSPFKWEKASKR